MCFPHILNENHCTVKKEETFQSNKLLNLNLRQKYKKYHFRRHDMSIFTSTKSMSNYVRVCYTHGLAFIVSLKHVFIIVYNNFAEKLTYKGNLVKLELYAQI